MDAFLLHPWGWHIFGGGGLWHWPLFVEADLRIAEAASFGARPPRLLRAKRMVDLATIFGKLGGVGMGVRSMM